MLLPCELDALQVGLRPVDRLRLGEARERSGREDGLYRRIDRVAQVLVEEARRDEPDRLQVVLEQQVVVVRPGRLQGRVAGAHRPPPVVLDDEGHEVAEVGTRDALAVDRPQVGLGVDLEPKLQVRQHARVGVVPARRDGRSVPPRAVRDDLVPGVGAARALHAHAGLGVYAADLRRVHRVGGVHLLRGVEVERVVGGVLPAEVLGEGARVAGHEAGRGIQARQRSERVLAEVVVGIVEGFEGLVEGQLRRPRRVEESIGVDTLLAVRADLGPELEGPGAAAGLVGHPQVDRARHLVVRGAILPDPIRIQDVELRVVDVDTVEHVETRRVGVAEIDPPGDVARARERDVRCIELVLS